MKPLSVASTVSPTQAIALLLSAITLALFAGAATAALPTAVQPAAGVAAGDYIALMQQYWKAGFAFLVLLIGAFTLLSAGGGAVAKFNEYRIGRAELSDLMVYMVAAVVVIVAVIYLLTEASTVL
jgi:integrating conjugative element membrane protein (TIGR03745 family)